MLRGQGEASAGTNLNDQGFNITKACGLCSLEDDYIPFPLEADDSKNPCMTSYGAIVPRITGGTSVVSSILIIYVILKSQAKLSTIYHRILFGMSIAGILSSSAIALTTLPMPSELVSKRSA